MAYLFPACIFTSTAQPKLNGGLKVCFTNQFRKDHRHDTNFYERAYHADDIDPAMLKIRERSLEFPETSSKYKYKYTKHQKIVI